MDKSAPLAPQFRETPTPHPDPECTFCLFADRHQMPPNSGAVFSLFDWKAQTAIYHYRNRKRIEFALRAGRTVWVYGTGLTAALTQLIAEMSALKSGRLVVLHFDHSRMDYFGNTVFDYDGR